MSIFDCVKCIILLVGIDRWAIRWTGRGPGSQVGWLARIYKASFEPAGCRLQKLVTIDLVQSKKILVGFKS